VPIKVNRLGAGKPLGFDLYHATPRAGRIMFLDGQNSFSENLKSRLLGAGAEVYIVRDDASKYYRHLEERLEPGTGDLSDPREAAAIATDVCRALLKRVFERPEEMALQRVERVVQAITRLVLHSDEAFRVLLELASHDHYTYTHSCNVGILSIGLTKRLGEQALGSEIEGVGAAFFFHDIGKTQIGPDLLNKPGPLNPSEEHEMRQHVKLGLEILKRRGTLSPETETIVSHHHGRFDGGGYLEGRAATNIPPLARVCAITDVFDALTSDRAYRPRYDPFQAMRLMVDNMAGCFDPLFLKRFILMFKELGYQR
jgi:putative nucleotidyltransferase with HDIG domain